ncbi:hypothetical protein [Azohydromonas sediminis]|uniref:hypothetical protein n=1 Tax=Azohydromonas sediminis TaxID=2259674 RepID=UPI000E64996B|nr:hypothetical protein [Azohydromonas sediminis]
MRLKERIYDCVQAGHYAMAALLRLVDVVETDAVPSAAVECSVQPHLLVNPAFVECHAATPEKLLMLVLHEVHHVLLGHTRMLPVATRADNFVFDAVINAMLSRALPQPAFTALFRDFYRDDRFPECLLRPPEGWWPGVGDVPVPPALRDESLAPVLDVYQALYSREGATYADLRQVLAAFVARLDSALDGVTLLGDHDPSRGHGLAGSVFTQAVAEVARDWPPFVGPWQGQTVASLATLLLRVRREPGARAQLRALIAKVAGVREGGTAAPFPVATTLEIESPLPAFDRRAVVARALGVTPLLYRHEMVMQRPVPARERVHVYLDVSGSMNGVREALYGAVLDCAAYVHPRVHLFSEQVSDVTLAQMRRGRCRSTGGNDIRCVTRHMAEHRVRRAVMLTDGWVGQPDEADVKVLERVRLGVAYAGRTTATHYLGPYAKATVMLPVGD